MSISVDRDIETDVKCLGIHDETPHETHDFEKDLEDFVAQVQALLFLLQNANTICPASLQKIIEGHLVGSELLRTLSTEDGCFAVDDDKVTIEHLAFVFNFSFLKWTPKNELVGTLFVLAWIMILLEIFDKFFRLFLFGNENMQILMGATGAAYGVSANVSKFRTEGSMYIKDSLTVGTLVSMASLGAFLSTENLKNLFNHQQFLSTIIPNYERRGLTDTREVLGIELATLIICFKRLTFFSLEFFSSARDSELIAISKILSVLCVFRVLSEVPYPDAEEPPSRNWMPMFTIEKRSDYALPLWTECNRMLLNKTKAIPLDQLLATLKTMVPQPTGWVKKTQDRAYRTIFFTGSFYFQMYSVMSIAGNELRQSLLTGQGSVLPMLLSDMQLPFARPVDMIEYAAMNVFEHMIWNAFSSISLQNVKRGIYHIYRGQRAHLYELLSLPRFPQTEEAFIWLLVLFLRDRSHLKDYVFNREQKQSPFHSYLLARSSLPLQDYNVLSTRNDGVIYAIDTFSNFSNWLSLQSVNLLSCSATSEHMNIFKQYLCNIASFITEAAYPLATSKIGRYALPFVENHYIWDDEKALQKQLRQQHQRTNQTITNTLKYLVSMMRTKKVKTLKFVISDNQVSKKPFWQERELDIFSVFSHGVFTNQVLTESELSIKADKLRVSVTTSICDLNETPGLRDSLFEHIVFEEFSRLSTAERTESMVERLCGIFRGTAPENMTREDELAQIDVLAHLKKIKVVMFEEIAGVVGPIIRRGPEVDAVMHLLKVSTGSYSIITACR